MPDLLHPQLLLATIGAVLGLALILWSGLGLVRRWQALSPHRRWAVFAAAGVFETIYWLSLYAWFVEPSRLIIRRVEIISPDWRGPPLAIAALSDTHVGGPHVNAARVRRIVERVNGLTPDLVVLLGDYANGHLAASERSAADNSEIADGIAAFAGLRAPYGAVAVIGNHDVWYDRARIEVGLRAAGVAVLWNSHEVIARPGLAPLVVAGIADDTTGQPDIATSLQGAPAEADRIVLSHSPDPFSVLPHRAAQLMLAGHSHCGQVSVPLIGRPILPIRHKAYACGLIEAADARMYVTSGIGTSILPVRFLNPPEVVLITIRQ